MANTIVSYQDLYYTDREHKRDRKSERDKLRLLKNKIIKDLKRQIIHNVYIYVDKYIQLYSYVLQIVLFLKIFSLCYWVYNCITIRIHPWITIYFDIVTAFIA